MTMRSLGLSIYPDHSKFEDKAKYKKIIEYGNQLGYQTFLDVAPQIFDKLDIDYSDLSFFAEIGAAGIRLDQSFDGATEALLSYNPYGLIIELNMSNNVDYLNNIISYQANTPFIYGCHNFYPQRGTALPYNFFVECSKRFKKFNIHTAAFISSQVGKIGPWNVEDELPTLEQDRNLPIDIQAKYLFASALIDDVIIGNAYASEHELKAVANVNRYQLQLHVDYVADVNSIEKTIVEKTQHFRRGDMNEMVIRSTIPRITYKDVPNKPHNNTENFQRGDILIGNDNFGIYKNELQIVLKPHQDPRKNKVGSIAPEELFLLDFIKPWSKFKLTSK